MSGCRERRVCGEQMNGNGGMNERGWGPGTSHAPQGVICLVTHKKCLFPTRRWFLGQLALMARPFPMGGSGDSSDSESAGRGQPRAA